MSGLIDTNLLIYAANRDGPHHAAARSFLEGLLKDGETHYLCWPVIYEFLRVTTHPKVFRKPLGWKEAASFLSAFLESGRVVLLREGDDHFEVLAEILGQLRNPQGNLMHDAHIAAVLRENGLKTIYTHDADFRLFSFFNAVDPLT